MIKLLLLIALCAPILCELDDQQSAQRQIKLEDIERDNLQQHEQQSRIQQQQQQGDEEAGVRYVTGLPNQYQVTPAPYTPVHEADRTHSAPARYSLLSQSGPSGHSTAQPPSARFISQPQPQYVYVQAGAEQGAIEPQQPLIQFYPSYAQQAHLQPQLHYAQDQAYVMLPFLQQGPALQAQPVSVPQPGYYQPKFNLPSPSPTPYSPGYSSSPAPPQYNPAYAQGGPTSGRPNVISFSHDNEVPDIQSSTPSPNKYYKNVQFVSSTPSSILSQQYPQQQYPQQQYPQQQYPQQQYPQRQYPQQQYPQQQYPQQQYPQQQYPQQQYPQQQYPQQQYPQQQYPQQQYPQQYPQGGVQYAQQAPNVQPLHTSVNSFSYNQGNNQLPKSVAPLDYSGIQNVQQQSYPSYQSSPYDFYAFNNRQPTSLLDSYIPSSVLLRQNPQYSQRYPNNGGGYGGGYENRYGQQSQIDQAGGYNTIAYSAPLYPSSGSQLKRSSVTQTATPTKQSATATQPIKKA